MRRRGDAARAWDLRHKSDDRQLLFADDGRTAQAYHSPESIADDLPKAGLHLVGEPVKVHYPWPLAERFDYGYFPDAPEEIWDWYVEAQIAPKTVSKIGPHRGSVRSGPHQRRFMA